MNAVRLRWTQLSGQLVSGEAGVATVSYPCHTRVIPVSHLCYTRVILASYSRWARARVIQDVIASRVLSWMCGCSTNDTTLD